MTTENYYDKNIEDMVAGIVVDKEYSVSKTNRKNIVNNYEAAIDMLECVRSEKDYEWMSDIFFPEFPAMLLTDASIWAQQYFQSRDFVEVYLETETEEDTKKAKATKKLINKTLNNRGINHYQKYMRARIINALCGEVYIKCWWERKMGVAGIVYDRFNYDVIDPRNVFTDNSYTYSIQDKQWITIRSEMTYSDIFSQASTNQYINLNLLKEQEKAVSETETSKETYNKSDKNQTYDTIINKKFDILERCGSFWCVVEEVNELGVPIKIAPGLDSSGMPLENAELLETIITYAQSGNSRVLIRFQVTPYIDSKGMPYKPICRGLCYIHPSKDTGLSSGSYARELQIALNDTFNISNDRVKLATMPVTKGNKNSLQDNTSIYWEPGHTMLMDNPQTDLVEMQIKDNVTSALNQISMIRGAMNQLEAIQPNTMGALPEDSSTTATAIAGAESRTNTRGNYKSLTIEHTLLVELYWMIMQMTYIFAKPETALKILGEADAIIFDPDADYTFVPISQNIELEHNKMNKLRMADQLIGRIVNVPNPKTPALLNKLLSMSFEYLGAEFRDFKNVLLDESVPIEGGGVKSQVGKVSTPTSNQSGVPMSGSEQAARAASGAIH